MIEDDGVDFAGEDERWGRKYCWKGKKCDIPVLWSHVSEKGLGCMVRRLFRSFCSTFLSFFSYMWIFTTSYYISERFFVAFTMAISDRHAPGVKRHGISWVWRRSRHHTMMTLLLQLHT